MIYGGTTITACLDSLHRYLREQGCYELHAITFDYQRNFFYFLLSSFPTPGVNQAMLVIISSTIVTRPS